MPKYFNRWHAAPSFILESIDHNVGHVLRCELQHASRCSGEASQLLDDLADRQATSLQALQLRDKRSRNCEVPLMDRIKCAAKDHLGAGLAHWRICPSPRTTHFSVVKPSKPTGPLACNRSVEIPISAPNPYSKPSANALSIDHDGTESTSRMKRLAPRLFGR